MPAGIKIGGIDPRDWFTAAVHKAFVNVEGDRFDPGWHHPSSLSHPCDRNKQFKFIGAPYDVKANFLLQFTSDVGTHVHNRIQELIKGHPKVLGYEEECVDHDLRVRGSSDLRVHDPDGVETILDMKTVSTPQKEARNKDILQVLWYMKMFNTLRGGIVYITRNNGQIKRFTIEWKDWEHVWKMSRDNALFITEETLQSRPVPMTSPSRRYCEERCRFISQCDKIQRNDLTTWLPLVENTKRVLSQSESE